MGTYDTIGGTPRHDPAFDADGQCELCMQPGDDCVCPECPVCGAAGQPRCYVSTHVSKYADGDHGMLLNAQQLRARAAAVVDVEVIFIGGAYRVMFSGLVCSPRWNERGPAKAYVDLLKRGLRAPEFPKL